MRGGSAEEGRAALASPPAPGSIVSVGESGYETTWMKWGQRWACEDRNAKGLGQLQYPEEHRCS